MTEVDISLVKYDDFSRLDPRAQLSGPLVVVVASGVHYRKTREKTLQIQAQMTLGGGLAPTMLGPIHARGDQGNGRRIHQVNRPLELAGKSLSRLPAHEPRRDVTQVFINFPEGFLGHLRWADLFGVGKIVATRRTGTAYAGKWAGM